MQSNDIEALLNAFPLPSQHLNLSSLHENLHECHSITCQIGRLQTTADEINLKPLGSNNFSDIDTEFHRLSDIYNYITGFGEPTIADAQKNITKQESLLKSQVSNIISHTSYTISPQTHSTKWVPVSTVNQQRSLQIQKDQFILRQTISGSNVHPPPDTESKPVFPTKPNSMIFPMPASKDKAPLQEKPKSPSVVFAAPAQPSQKQGKVGSQPGPAKISTGQKPSLSIPPTSLGPKSRPMTPTSPAFPHNPNSIAFPNPQPRPLFPAQNSTTSNQPDSPPSPPPEEEKMPHESAQKPSEPVPPDAKPQPDTKQSEPKTADPVPEPQTSQSKPTIVPSVPTTTGNTSPAFQFVAPTTPPGTNQFAMNPMKPAETKGSATKPPSLTITKPPDTLQPTTSAAQSSPKESPAPKGESPANPQAPTTGSAPTQKYAFTVPGRASSTTSVPQNSTQPVGLPSTAKLSPAKTQVPSIWDTSKRAQSSGPKSSPASNVISQTGWGSPQPSQNTTTAWGSANPQSNGWSTDKPKEWKTG